MTQTVDARTAVVTGGTSGLGLEISRALMLEGVKVHLWARSRQRGEQAAAYLNGLLLAGTATFSPVDVADPEAVLAAARPFVQSRSAVDILINAAGLLRRTSIDSANPLDIDEMCRVMLRGPMLVTEALLPALESGVGGVIVNIGSAAGRVPIPSLAAYGAIKAAVEHFTRSAAHELLTRNIRALCVCPGVLPTALVPRAELALIARTLPRRRLQRVEEVASFIAMLTQPTFGSLTGAVIDMDDGVSMFPRGLQPEPSTPGASAAASGSGSGATTNVPETAEPAPAARASDVIRDRVAEVFTQVFGIAADDLADDTGPERVASWDSIGQMRVIAALEKTFHCEFAVDDVMNMASFGAIVSIVKSKLGPG